MSKANVTINYERGKTTEAIHIPNDPKMSKKHYYKLL